MHVLGVPFLRHLAGHSLMAQFFGQGNFRYGHAFDQTFWPSRQAILSRNIASRQGREDYIRVRLEHQANGLPRAVPVPGPVGAPSDVAGFGRAGAHFRTDRRP